MVGPVSVGTCVWGASVEDMSIGGACWAPEYPAESGAALRLGLSVDTGTPMTPTLEEGWGLTPKTDKAHLPLRLCKSRQVEVFIFQ